ncbi:MAG: DNA recombination protein RmuC [Phycisphaeraceae bacterium]
MELSAGHFLLFAVGLVLGVGAAWYLMKGKLSLARAEGRADLNDVVGKLRQENAGLIAEIEAKQHRIGELHAAEEKLAEARTSIATLKAELEQERRVTPEKLQLLTRAREELTNHFKALAAEVLDDKSEKFTSLNRRNINDILTPLKEKITSFQAKVEEAYVKESKDRSALTRQVEMLKEMNNRLSQDAQNLTLALKGDRKAQGDWGQIILEEVLEKAGLVQGQHYDVQDNVTLEDAQSRLIPDVVVHLPGDRHIVVDSKFTLPDYRAFADAEDETERAAALKRHLVATRAHMKGLSDKKYQTLYGLGSLDFVVMFMPLEPAFMLAVTNDRDLFHEGWDRNVLLVSPSTLLFVIRTVANLWRQEDLRHNAQEISRRGAELYDKLVGFVDDLQKVGDRLTQAQNSYEEARKKLSQGRGNVIRQAEMLRELGVKPSKALPAKLTEAAADEAAAALTGEGTSDADAGDGLEQAGATREDA